MFKTIGSGLITLILIISVISTAPAASYEYNSVSSEQNVTADDLVNFKDYFRLLAMAWWKNRSGDKTCDKCNQTIFNGEGYVYGDWNGRDIISNRLLCDNCIDRFMPASDLERLKEDPDYYGRGKLAKARLYGELMRPTPHGIVSFRQQCKERYERLLGDRANRDLLSGEPIEDGDGYMVTGGDYKNASRVIALYVDHYMKNEMMSREQALTKIEKLRINNILIYHNLAVSGKNIHLFEP